MTDITRIDQNLTRKVYDCFMFNGESDILSIRLNELSDIVDVFVIVEANITFSGLARTPEFDRSDNRFSKFRNRIKHVIVTNIPETTDPWTRERWQRNGILYGLADANPDDLILISDVDEIPKASVVKEMASKDPSKIFALRLTLSYFYFNYCCTAGVDATTPWTVGTSFENVRSITPDALRYGVRDGKLSVNLVADAGWHFSYAFDEDGIKKKIASFSHQEFNNPEFLSSIDIADIVSKNADLFGERGNVWTKCPESNLPQFVKENREVFRKYLTPSP